MKNCPVCNEIKEDSEFNKSSYTKTGLRSQCKACMKIQRKGLRDHYKEWRNTPERKIWYAEYHKARYHADKTKHTARNKTRVLKKEPHSCEVCGADKAQAHHDDYTKPLDVRWLCRAHHNEWHSKNTAKT